MDHNIACYHGYLAALTEASSSSRLSSLSDARFHSAARIQSVQQQLNCFILLHHLRSAEEAIAAAASPAAPSSSSSSSPASPVLLDPQFSHRHAVLNIISSSPSLTRALAVIDWLEELAEATSVVLTSGSATLRKTLRRLQRSGASGALSIDSELLKAGGMRLEPADREEEAALLRSVWLLIRAGKLQEAISLCVDWRQAWRAASLSGGQLWHVDESGSGVGNRRHFLWKETCRRLAASPAVGEHERAIYSLLGSELRGLLPVCQSWEDCVWAMHRVMVDTEIDALLARASKDDSERRLAAPPASAQQLSPSAIFDRLTHGGDSSLPVAATKAAHAVYQQLQRLLVLAQYEQAEEFIAERVEEERDEELLPFAVHLYLYLHPRCPAAPLTPPGQRVFVAYLRYLQRHGQHHLVPLYASFLSPADQLQHYSAFLLSLPSVAARVQYLRVAQQYFPDTVLSITTRLVEAIILDDSPAAGQQTEGDREADGSRAVSAADREKVEMLSCFLVSSPGDRAALLEAMRLSCLLFRQLLKSDRLPAARLLSEALLTNRFDQLAVMEGKEAAGEEEEEEVDAAAVSSSSSAADRARTRIEHEYAGWMQYVRCMSCYSAWTSKLAVKPARPLPIKASAALTPAQQQSDRRRYERELQRYGEEEAEWRRGWQEVSELTVEAILKALQQDECGWMRRAGPELDEWRRRIIPSLLFVLHRVCDVSEMGSGCLQVAELLVDERYRLYDAMTVEERRACMRQLKDSFVKYVLAKDEDRRRGAPRRPLQQDVTAQQLQREAEAQQEAAEAEEDEDMVQEQEEEKYPQEPEVEAAETEAELRPVQARDSLAPMREEMMGRDAAGGDTDAEAWEEQAEAAAAEEEAEQPREEERVEEQDEPAAASETEQQPREEQREEEEDQLQQPLEPQRGREEEEEVMAEAAFADVGSAQEEQMLRAVEAESEAEEEPEEREEADVPQSALLASPAIVPSPAIILSEAPAAPNPFQAEPVAVVEPQPQSSMAEQESEAQNEAERDEERRREEEKQADVARVTRRSSRQPSRNRRGPSASRSRERQAVAAGTGRKEEQTEAEAAAVPGSPASVAESIASAVSQSAEEGEAVSRQRTRSSRRVSRPIEPSSRVLRTRK